MVNGIMLVGDKMSMAHSLEVRMPFLDCSVVDFALALPSRMKWRHGQEKYVLSLLTDRLPAEIAHRRKFPFQYPLRSMAKEPLASFIREFLLDSARPGGIINRRFLEDTLQNLGSRGWEGTRRILTLLTLQAWSNEFFPQL
jgi:asparagine synthase (glutamine-hydrolysing)